MSHNFVGVLKFIPTETLLKIEWVDGVMPELMSRIPPQVVENLSSAQKLQCLHYRGYTLSPATYLLAARNGDIGFLEWLDAVKIPRSPDTCTVAAMHGQLETLEYLRSMTYEWSWETCLQAVLRRDFLMVRWLRTRDPPCPWERYEFRPARALQEPVQFFLQLFELKRFEYVREVVYPCMTHAIQTNDVDMINFLREMGSPVHGLAASIVRSICLRKNSVS